jgi:hypothetical protein
MVEDVKVGDLVEVLGWGYVSAPPGTTLQINEVLEGGSVYAGWIGGGTPPGAIDRYYFRGGDYRKVPTPVPSEAPTIPQEAEQGQKGPDLPSDPSGLVQHGSGALRESKAGKGKPHLLLLSFPYALQQLSLHVDCELGRERNFEKGLPLSSFMDAALRHLTLWSCGDTEPHHLRAALWNIAAMMETEHRVGTGYLSEDLDDINREPRSEVKYDNQ